MLSQSISGEESSYHDQQYAKLSSRNNLGPSSDGVNTKTVVWGTTVNVVESMAMFKNFLLYFKPEDESEDMELQVVQFDSYYCRKLKIMKEVQDYNLNLDAQHLKSYEPSKKLYYQLLKYPQEIIPLMDHTLNETLFSLFDSVPLNTVCSVRPYNISERCIPLRELEPSGEEK